MCKSRAPVYLLSMPETRGGIKIRSLGVILRRCQYLDYVGVLISLWFSKGILFLQDSAPPHKAAITHQKLADLHFEVLKHPAYSPNLAPSDYYFFSNLFIKPKTYQPPLSNIASSCRVSSD
jgi:hypothetical protein